VDVPDAKVVSDEDRLHGENVLHQLLTQFPISRDRYDISYTKNVVSRLVEATESRSSDWTVTIFDDDSVKNAAATRGNFIFIWSGMLRTVRSEDELAAVLAHEIAHVLAGHVMPNPAEQISEALASVGGTTTADILASTGSTAPVVAQIGGAIIEQGIRGFLINPQSQQKEYEADQIGLFLMSDAGYNPDAAVVFWERAGSDPAFNRSDSRNF
jgi:predicted Zn-dependent protease